MEAKFYKVGGCVRDAILGLQSKDIDFSVEAESFEAMKRAVVVRCGGDPDTGDIDEGGPIIKVLKPEFVTIRAIDPKLGGVDFVLCRKDGAYGDGRRPDSVTIGTLLDDLTRRDFTMNAMAQRDDGFFFDPFNGMMDIQNKTIRCVGNCHDRFAEDGLRVLRAVRFAITKGFALHGTIDAYIAQMGDGVLSGVSVERTREELLKCFNVDTLLTLRYLDTYPRLRDQCFGSGKLFLKPTIRG